MYISTKTMYNYNMNITNISALSGGHKNYIYLPESIHTYNYITVIS